MQLASFVPWAKLYHREVGAMELGLPNVGAQSPQLLLPRHRLLSVVWEGKRRGTVGCYFGSLLHVSTQGCLPTPTDGAYLVVRAFNKEVGDQDSLSCSLGRSKHRSPISQESALTIKLQVRLGISYEHN